MEVTESDKRASLLRNEINLKCFVLKCPGGHLKWPRYYFKRSFNIVMNEEQVTMTGIKEGGGREIKERKGYRDKKENER